MAESSSDIKIITVGVAGVVERKEQKSRYAFDIVAEWSDGDRSSCQRSYQEFFTFHCQLLDLFPQEAGTVKGSTRVIPFLPGKKIFRRNNKSLADERLPQLDQYLKELIGALPEKVTSCAFVKKFINCNYNEALSQVSSSPNTKVSSSPEEKELTRSLEAVKIIEESGTVSYSPSVRGNHPPTKTVQDIPDQREIVQENSQEILQNDTESLNSETHSTGKEEVGVISNEEQQEETRPSDEAMEHESIVAIVQESNEDPAVTAQMLDETKVLEDENDEGIKDSVTPPDGEVTIIVEEPNEVSTTQQSAVDDDKLVENTTSLEETIVTTDVNSLDEKEPTPNIEPSEKQIDEASETISEEHKSE